MSETAFHLEVAKFLNAALCPEVFWFHCPNGGKRNKREAAKLKAMGVKAGVPDIGLIHQGKVWFIELKDKYRGLSESQEYTIPLIERAGCPEIPICRTLEQVQDAVLRFGLPLRGNLT